MGSTLRVLFGIGLLVLSGWVAAQTVEYIHTDALGSIVAVTDASGNVIERREYEPYGAQLTPAVQDGPGYTGHVQDAATGLTYMQERYYDPSIGVMLSVDPVTAYQQPVANFCRYCYGRNNPYKFTDPDGRQAIPLPFPALPPPVTGAWNQNSSGQVPEDGGRRDDSGVRSGERDGTRTPRGDGTRTGRPIIADRPLPRSEGGEPVPDPGAEGVPHTQLGKGEGRKVGDYPTAREFDSKGRPVRDIDFTDHGRPKEHTDPHQHPYKDNPTGGTRQRGPAEPLPRMDEN